MGFKAFGLKLMLYGPRLAEAGLDPLIPIVDSSREADMTLLQDYRHSILRFSIARVTVLRSGRHILKQQIQDPANKITSESDGDGESIICMLFAF